MLYVYSHVVVRGKIIDNNNYRAIAMRARCNCEHVLASNRSIFFSSYPEWHDELRKKF